jgi:hypothetical protein
VELNVTQCGPKVLGMIFLHGCTVFLKTAENSSFWTFFKSLVTASWISATSAVQSLVTSFSTWGTENSLAEIKLESTGGGGQQEKISRAEILFQNPKNYSLGDVQRFCYHS